MQEIVTLRKQAELLDDPVDKAWLLKKIDNLKKMNKAQKTADWNKGNRNNKKAPIPVKTETPVNPTPAPKPAEKVTPPKPVEPVKTETQNQEDLINEIDAIGETIRSGEIVPQETLNKIKDRIDNLTDKTVAKSIKQELNRVQAQNRTNERQKKANDEAEAKRDENVLPELTETKNNGRSEPKPMPREKFDALNKTISQRFDGVERIANTLPEGTRGLKQIRFALKGVREVFAKNKGRVTTQEEQHKMVFALAEELMRLETNISRMDISEEERRRFMFMVKSIKDNYLAKEYEIFNMLGKRYYEGMNVTGSFIPNDKIEKGKTIITKVIKPQVNFKGKMIQAAHIEVSVGTKEPVETERGKEEVVGKPVKKVKGIPVKEFKKPTNLDESNRQPVDTAKQIVGAETEREFAVGVTAKGNFSVVELDNVQASHYNGERNPYHLAKMQPKERTIGDTHSARKNARRKDPTKLLIDIESPYDGAININSRGEVIQGNNRAESLEFVYENEAQAKKYKDGIIKKAKEFGFTDEQIALIMKMDKPVLANLIDVDDETAIRLGSYKQEHRETGGKRDFEPVSAWRKLDTTKQKRLVKKITQYLSKDTSATINAVARDNSGDILNFLAKEGAISNEELRGAFTDRGEINGKGMQNLKEIIAEAIISDTSVKK